MPSSTTCRRWPSGSIASTNGWLMSMRRPLDLSIRSTSSSHLRGGEHQVGQLVAAVAGDEDPAGVVDPDLLDGRVVEEGLQRPEAGHPRHQLTDHGVDVGHRGDGAGEAALVVVAHDALGDPADDGGVDAAGPRPRGARSSRTCSSSCSTSRACASACVTTMVDPVVPSVISAAFLRQPRNPWQWSSPRPCGQPATSGTPGTSRDLWGDRRRSETRPVVYPARCELLASGGRE